MRSLMLLIEVEVIDVFFYWSAGSEEERERGGRSSR